MIRYRFSRTINKEFSSILRSRINAYFRENAISKSSNPQMLGKSVIALSLYLMPFLFLLLSGIGNLYFITFLWVLMGLGKAFIGTSVMHDALHGAYSKNETVNFLMGISAYLVGANPKIWQIQHNVLHHTFTNVEHADEDIAPRYVLRFTPHQPRKWFHRFQHIYAFFFYGISTLTWVTFKDFVKVFDYRKKGLIKEGSEFRKYLSIIIFQKILYMGVFLVLPMYLVPIPAWITLMMFILMHFVAGLILTLIFQTAHVMPDSEFLMQEDPQIEENWWAHQLHTTSNYAMNSKIFGWFIGGLNFQIEHHLFPGICHVHYPKIASIVQQTTAEFNLPYYAHNRFSTAVIEHFKLLRQLGKYNALPVS